ncbi:phosphomannomutase CpsG [Nitrospina watsonii]|uniref:Phosphomannomutase n=1 Tax=Nitrospina watsonii TaxID=1323948 RepID=A0ABM9HA87_9BACT|nr:phosphomannomutase CpsG [Nitrospina watsonii]CAI2717062.1 phosphomannomutase [Nitrospina watsonii]
MNRLTCFKAYDVRGKLGEEINDEIAYRIGRAYAQYLGAGRVVAGGDVRLTSEPLKQALAEGIMDAGADVIDIGMTGTEEVYFAAFHLDVDGGVEVTASHNPMDYNGMKFVGRGASPISGESGLREIRRIAEQRDFRSTTTKGKCSQSTVLDAYIDHLFGYIEPANLRPLRLVVNAGNGAAGHVIDAIEARVVDQRLPVEFIKVHHEPDGSFPNGIPNPLLPENRAATAEAVREHGADMGIAWDGDFDRCFLFDENGAFIEGYYIVGLLAQAFLKKHPGEKIIHDPRLIWNTLDMVKKAGGIPVQCKAGHAYIKERMRAENAIYGGEMSAHHYFRDFAYCDSGMIPWLLIAELLSVSGKPLSVLVSERVAAYPCSGEINFKVENTDATMEKVKNHFCAPLSLKDEENGVRIDTMDGLSLEFSDWRFNLRASNTEPLLRLNIETRGDVQAVGARLTEIKAILTRSA